MEEELSAEHEISSFVWFASLTMEKAILIPRVKGYDIPVVANLTFSRSVISLGMDVKTEELVPVFAQRMKTPIEPQMVTGGPVTEEVLPTANLMKSLPVLTHYAGDSSPFITTGLVSARDPDTGVTSRGVYRMELRGEKELGIALHNPPVADLYRKFKDRGEPLPVAVVIGVEPITFLAAALKSPPWVDKLAIAGGLRNSPLKVSPGAVTDIPVPAHAEFLLEGELDAEDERQDGPLGEISGYYLTIPKTPTFKVKRISHRDSPFYHALLPTGKEADLLLTFTAEASFSPRLRELFPFVLDFHFIPRTFGSSVVVRVTETEREHVRSLILHLLSMGMIKKVVVVDEEIKAEEPGEVEWAIITRCQPDKDSIVIGGLRGQAIDPSCPEIFQTAKLGIDATGFDSVKGWVRVSFPKESLSKAQSLLKSQNASAKSRG
ncbi:UbiD family decarboxylase [Dehalococcoidia bacterium]|nr:UbiD family decarboxylase [Dehalococcoidia bacterium]